MPKKYWFRMLENGNEFWRGTAYDAEHAQERAFEDEEPGSLVKYTLERLDGKMWITVYENKKIV